MAQIKAYSAQSETSPLIPATIERRMPTPKDVSINIEYCGICHTDIHQVRNEWGGSLYPMVPGHEITGTVTAVGDNVTRFKVGDRVGVGCFVDSCRSCQDCQDGLEQYCANGLVLTYNSKEHDGTPTMGGYSEKIVVNEDYVLRIPDNLPLDAAAPLLCAGITLYSPLRHWGVGAGKKVAIIGLGGLGHIGVKIAHAMGAEVTVLSQSLSKKEDGLRLGADHYYATSDPSTFEALQSKFDVIINTVSAALDWNLYLNLLKRDGALVVVGIPDTNIPVNAFPLVMGRKSVAGSLIGGIRETQEMLDFCGSHNIACDIELIPIQKVNEAYERVLKSDVKFRFVIDMASLKA